MLRKGRNNWNFVPPYVETALNGVKDTVSARTPITIAVAERMTFSGIGVRSNKPTEKTRRDEAMHVQTSGRSIVRNAILAALSLPDLAALGEHLEPVCTENPIRVDEVTESRKLLKRRMRRSDIR